MKKWIVRGLVFVSLGGMTLVALLYQYLTNPESVRRQVLDRVEKDLVDVQAVLGAARLRLFGGIEVSEFRLSRKDDLDKNDFLYVPSATLYHDKEHVLEGGLRLRKIEVRRLRIRAIREHDGRWNLSGLLGPSNLGKRLPAVVVRQGTLVVEDRQAAPGTPPLEVQDVNVTLINDPLPTVSFDGSGVIEGAGTVRIRGRATRGGGRLSLNIEARDVTVGPDLVQRLSGYVPEMAKHLRGLSAHARLSARITFDPKARSPLRYSVEGEVFSGEFSHARLPRPLEKLSGSFKAHDGQVPEAKLRAHSGATEVEVSLHGLRLEPGLNWTDRADQLDLHVRHFPVDEKLFEYLPENLRNFQQEYSPEGTASLHLEIKRITPTVWQQSGTLEAEGGQGCYQGFRYPVKKVRGNVRWQLAMDPKGTNSMGSPDDWISMDLRGEADGKPVNLKGRIEGEKGQSEIKIDLWGNEMSLDERLIGLLPSKPQYQTRNFQPSGRIDYRVFLRRERGKKELTKRFLIHLHQGKVCYKVFPLPLTDVSGTLDFRPDSWEFRDFVGRYNGGIIRASGRSRPMPSQLPGSVAVRQASDSVQPISRAVEEKESPASRISVAIEGQNLPIDEPFKAALAPGREALAKAFDTFNLTGRLNFSANIDDLPNRPRDVDVTVRVGGCRIVPTFFPYSLEEVAATVRYAKSNVWVSDFQGRHGKTVVFVKQGTVVLPSEGGYWAKLTKLQANPLTLDADLQKALPGGVGKLTKMLKVSEPVNLATVLVINQSPAAGARPTVYWDATLALKDTDFQAGPDWTGVSGVINSQGLHNGSQIEDVTGNVFLEKATILNQPLRNVHLPLVIWKESPDVLRLPDVKADLFGGMIDGQGRVEFGSIFRYEMELKASRIQLGQLGSHNFGGTAELSGQANASLHLEGTGPDLDGIKGNGRIDVPSGKMYRLPLFLDLLKWLGLRLPDRTAFEQAHAAFRIEGPRLHVNELELYGNAISVRGDGSMNLNGSDLRLDLNADWGRLSQLLPTGINNLSRELSNQLLRVKVRGKVGDLKFEQELVPIVTDPLKKFWSRDSSQTKRQGDKETRR